MCAENNMQVCNFTTPAQIYHALRRQIRRPFRKPLIVMSPKSLLRHPKAKSTLEELADGHLQEVIPDTTIKDAKSVDAVILCSGKVYYDLLEERETLKLNDKKALVRVEQIYPFPDQHLGPILKSYPKIKSVVWCQEEPKNMGAWTFVHPRIEGVLADLGLKVEFRYAGRSERASPAIGSEKKHKVEQHQLVDLALKGEQP
jgi:2-oxoglutarate dehydrogenase E1 component